jgi:VanZ family protein
VLLSSIPGQQMPSGAWWRADKLIHVVEYAVLAALVVRALRLGPPRATVLIAAAIAVIGATVFGVTDELHQSFTPGRYSSALDVLADGIGAIVGAGAASLFYGRRGRAAR